MGLLSGLGGLVKTSLDTLATTVAHPIKVASAIVDPNVSVKQVTTEFFSQSQGKQFAQEILGTAAIAGTIVGGAAIAAASKAGTLGSTAATVAKALIPKSPLGKVLAVAAVPVVAGAIARQPEATAKAAVDLPSDLANFGGNVATAATDPTLNNAKQIIEENPLLSGLSAGVIAALLAKGLIPAAASIANTSATNDLTKAIENQQSNYNDVVPGVSIPVNSLPETAPVVAATKTAEAPQTPITPETQPLIATAGGSSTSNKKKRSSKKAAVPSVSQRINLLIQNNNRNTQNKKYINKELLLN